MRRGLIPDWSVLNIFRSNERKTENNFREFYICTIISPNQTLNARIEMLSRYQRTVEVTCHLESQYARDHVNRLLIWCPNLEAILEKRDPVPPAFGTNLMKGMKRSCVQSANKLQPSILQTAMLHLLPIPKNISRKQYCQLFGAGPQALLNVDAMGSSHEDDLDERMEFIVKLSQKLGTKQVNLMDGHGRCAVRLSAALPAKTEILIHEIDETTHAWHQKTMPSAMPCKSNILEYLSTCAERGTLKPGGKLFYLNFCGLMGQSDTIAWLLAAMTAEERAQVVISFARVRGAIAEADALEVILTDLGYTRVTSRGDFVTLAATNMP